MCAAHRFWVHYVSVHLSYATLPGSQMDNLYRGTCHKQYVGCDWGLVVQQVSIQVKQHKDYSRHYIQLQQHKRANKRWTINEVLTLQREYELLEMDIDEIATRHERSVDGIAYKLKSEGFIDLLENARGYFNDMPPLIPSPALQKTALQAPNVDISLDVRLSALEMSIERINASLSLLALSNKHLKFSNAM